MDTSVAAQIFDENGDIAEANEIGKVILAMLALLFGIIIMLGLVFFGLIKLTIYLL